MHKALKFVLYGTLWVAGLGVASQFVDGLVSSLVLLTVAIVAWAYRQTLVGYLRSAWEGSR